jgi:hypothetical protein
MNLSVLKNTFVVLRLNKDATLPNWINHNEFYSITKTRDELSIVCVDENIPQHEFKMERSWKIIKVEGPLDFSLTGILASILNPLAQAKISIFSLSTFDTDYIMVKEEKLESALSMLQKAGFKFV